MKKQYYSKVTNSLGFNYIIVALFFMTTSCVTREACERKFPLIKSDSVIISTNTITKIKDTTISIEIKGDFMNRSVPLNHVSRLKTEMASSKAWIENGKLRHTLVQKDTVIAKQLKQAYEAKITSIRQKELIFNKENTLWERKISVIYVLVGLLVWLLYLSFRRQKM